MPKNPGLLKWAGPVGAGLMAGGLIQGENGDTGGVRDYLGNIARGAGVGGTIGSFIPLPGATLIGAGIGGLGGALFEYFDEDTNKMVEGAIPMPPDNRMSIEDYAALWDKYNPAGGGGGGGGAASALGEQEMQILRDYWATLNQYGTNRAQALNQLFSGVSAARARSGQAVERGGTNLAADIENLYNRLGAQASAPVVAEGSPTAGLAPVAGQMATAAQTVPSEGQNLANYLAAATGSEARNIYDIASAQALQGAGMTQGFLDMLAMAEQEQIAQQRRINAQRVANAQQAAANYANQRNAARNQFLFEAEANLLGEGRAAEDAAWQIKYIKATDKNAYKEMEKITKQFEGSPTPEEFIQMYPNRATLLLPNLGE